MARIRSIKRCLVRIDPQIWREPSWTELTGLAQWAYMDSLFQLATIGQPAGVYRAEQLANHADADQAASAAAALVRLAAWEPTGDGWHVRPYCGWAVVPERRAAIPAAVRAAVYARCAHQCVRCAATDDLALDHIYPWSLGGPDTEDNLQVLCRSCNSSKGAKI